ncbi:hypothetical protein R3I94_009913 [Phoxinus phoxinus]
MDTTVLNKPKREPASHRSLHLFLYADTKKQPGCSIRSGKPWLHNARDWDGERSRRTRRLEIWQRSTGIRGD